MTFDTQEQCDAAHRFDETGTTCEACNCVTPDSDMTICEHCGAEICGDCARKGLCECKETDE